MGVEKYTFWVDISRTTISIEIKPTSAFELQKQLQNDMSLIVIQQVVVNY